MIVDVIGNYLALNKKGNDFNCKCPFHNDTKPSLFVSEKKNCFKCFACGVGGNAIGFVMKMENCDYNEAKLKINQILNKEIYKIDQDENFYSSQQSKVLETFIKYTNLYLTSNEKGNKALEYLKARGIELETINNNKIGYAIDDKKELVDLLIANNNFSLKDLIDSSIVTVDKNGNFISSFQNRITVPIYEKNKLVGWTSRLLVDNNDLPKYFNSKNLEKGRYLLGIDNIDSETEILFVCEGIFDYLTLMQLNLPAVCTMGSQVSNEQINKILSMNNLKQVLICFDNDKAGYLASLELFKKLRANNKWLTVNFFDWYKCSEKDINELYINNKDVLVEKIYNCVDLNLFKTNHYVKTLDPKHINNQQLLFNLVNTTNSLFKSVIVNRFKENGFNLIVDYFAKEDICEFLKKNEHLLTDNLKVEINKNFITPIFKNK